jgi:hypothetical protein
MVEGTHPQCRAPRKLQEGWRVDKKSPGANFLCVYWECLILRIFSPWTVSSWSRIQEWLTVFETDLLATEFKLLTYVHLQQCFCCSVPLQVHNTPMCKTFPFHSHSFFLFALLSLLNSSYFHFYVKEKELDLWVSLREESENCLEGKDHQNEQYLQSFINHWEIFASIMSWQGVGAGGC